MGLGNSIHRWVREGKLEAVRICLEQKPERLEKVSYCEDKEGGIDATPLQLAAMCGKSSGANIENPTADGKTPLHFAAWCGYKDTTLKLIDAGANVNSRTKAGDTPLMMAAYRGYIDIVHLLLLNGARKDDVNNDGLTALEFIQHKEDRQDIVAVLNYAL